MSYRIEYHKPQDGCPMRLPVLTAMCMIAFLLLVHWRWPEGSEVIRTMLISAENAIGISALDRAVAALEAGESAAQTVSVFLGNLRS